MIKLLYFMISSTTLIFRSCALLIYILHSNGHDNSSRLPISSSPCQTPQVQISSILHSNSEPQSVFQSCLLYLFRWDWSVTNQHICCTSYSVSVAKLKVSGYEFYDFIVGICTYPHFPAGRPAPPGSPDFKLFVKKKRFPIDQFGLQCYTLQSIGLFELSL